MKHVSLIKLVIGLTGLVFANVYADSSVSSPAGYWKTIDDISGKPKSIVHIWEDKNHSLVGQVVKIYPSPGKDEHELCVACKGESHDKPIVGLVIMSGLTAKENQWGSGEILDPQNGKTYNCSARLAENGSKLNVRGYIGLPLLGRSQTWERVDSQVG